MLDTIVTRLTQPQLPFEDRLVMLRALRNYLIGNEERKSEALARTDFRLLDYLLSQLREAASADKDCDNASLSEQALVLLNSICLTNSEARTAALAAGAARLSLQAAIRGAQQQQQQRGPRLCQAALRTLRTLVGAQLIVTESHSGCRLQQQQQQLQQQQQQQSFTQWEPVLIGLPETGAECLTQVSSLNFLLSLLSQPGPQEHLLNLLAAAATDKAAAFHLYAHGAMDSLTPLFLTASISCSYRRRSREGRCRLQRDVGTVGCCLRLLAMLCWRVPDAAARLVEVDDRRVLDRIIELLQPGLSNAIRCLSGICLALVASHRVAASAAAAAAAAAVSTSGAAAVASQVVDLPTSVGSLSEVLLHRVVPDAVCRVSSEAAPLTWRCISLDALVCLVQSGAVPLAAVAHCHRLLLDGLLDGRLLAAPACRPLLPRLLRLFALLSPVWPRQPALQPLQSLLVDVASAFSASGDDTATGHLPPPLPPPPPPPESLRSSALLLLHALSRRTDCLLQLFGPEAPGPQLADFAADCLQRLRQQRRRASDDGAAAFAAPAAAPLTASMSTIALSGNLLLPHCPCRSRLLTAACLNALLRLLQQQQQQQQQQLRLRAAWALANASFDCPDDALWQLLADNVPSLLADILDEMQLQPPTAACSLTACKLLEAIRNLFASPDRADQLAGGGRLLALLERSLDPCLPDCASVRPAALAALANAANGGPAARLGLLAREALLLRLRDCLGHSDPPLPQLSLRILSNLMEPRSTGGTVASAPATEVAGEVVADPQCRSTLLRLGFPDQLSKLLHRSPRQRHLNPEEAERAERLWQHFWPQSSC